MAMMRPNFSLAHFGNNGTENVKGAVQIHIEHALEGGVIGLGHRLAAGETADQMGQHIDFSEARDHAGNRFLRPVQAVERGRKRDEICVVEVGLLDSRCDSGDRETGIQQGFRDVSAEAAVGSGDEGDLSGHKHGSS